MKSLHQLSRYTRIAIITIVFFFSCVTAAHANVKIGQSFEALDFLQNGYLPVDTIPDITVTRLSERILQLKVRGQGLFSTNIVVVATQKGLVVIDTWHAPFIFEQIGDIVEQQFGRRDFAYVINSHEDVDHASGNGFFKDITMIGHENLFKSLKKRHTGRKQWESSYQGRIQGYIKGGEEKLARLDKTTKEAKELMADLRVMRKLDKNFKDGFPILPDNPKAVISFNDKATLDLGDVTLECYACKVGHTSSDILVYIPEEGFLFTGDATQVYIPKNVNRKHWLGLLEHFLKPDAKVNNILTGHGDNTFTSQELKSLYEYLNVTWESVRKAYEKGLSLDQIKNQYSLDNEMSRFRSLVYMTFNTGTLEQFKKKHDNNIETIFYKLSQP